MILGDEFFKVSVNQEEKRGRADELEKNKVADEGDELFSAGLVQV